MNRWNGDVDDSVVEQIHDKSEGHDDERDIPFAMGKLARVMGGRVGCVRYDWLLYWWL